MAKGDTRMRIICAAADLIHRQGYRATTIDDVLDASGVKKGNLYYYFDSKEDLGLAVLEYFQKSHAESVRRALTDSTLNPRERLVQWMMSMAGSVAQAQCKCGCPFGNLAMEMSDQNELFRQRIADHFELWRGLIADTVREGQVSGDINPDLDAADYASHFVLMIEGAILMCKLTRELKPVEMAIADARSRLECAPAGVA